MIPSGWAYKRTVIGIAMALIGVGLSSKSFSPVLIDALQQSRKLTPSLAGLVQTLELITAAAAAFPLAMMTSGVSTRKLAVAGALTATGCHLLSGMVEPLALLIALRIGAGIGAAACICAANVVLSAQPNPDRIFATCYAIMCVAGVIELPVMVHVSTATGGWGAYAIQGVITLVMIPMIAMLPIVRATPPQHNAKQDRLALPPAMWLPIVSLFLFTIFAVGLWAFAGTVAKSAHVSPDVFGYSLSAGTGISIGAAALAAWLGTRFGRILPIVVGLGISGVASTIFFSSESPAPYLVSFVFCQASYSFVMPFLMGFCSSLDSTGRLGTTASSTLLLGSAVAPASIGWLIDSSGLPTLIYVQIACYVVAGLAFCIAIDAARRQPGAARSDGTLAPLGVT